MMIGAEFEFSGCLNCGFLVGFYCIDCSCGWHFGGGLFAMVLSFWCLVCYRFLLSELRFGS